MALAVGDDDGLKDGLQHGVGELKLHLLAARFGIPQLTQANSDPAQLAGDHAPLHAMLQIALGDALCIASQHVERPQHKENRRHLHEQCRHNHKESKSKLPGCLQRSVRNGHQAHREAAEEHATENESLSKVEHDRYPYP